MSNVASARLIPLNTTNRRVSLNGSMKAMKATIFRLDSAFGPVRNGPWEEACHPSIVKLQPLLYKPFRARRGRQIN